MTAKDEIRILVVEDNQLSQEMIATFLEDAGYTVHTADNGAVAVELLRMMNFSLVLMDIEMPEMNGFEATRLIRHELKSDVPVIAFTAHDTATEQQKCIAAGMNACLVKPVDPELLSKTISEQLKRKEEMKLRTLETPAISLPENGELVDLTYLENIAKGNLKFFYSMIDIFLEQNTKDMKLLRDAVRDMDFENIQLISHKIKTSITFIGLEKYIHAHLVELETMGRKKEHPYRIWELLGEVDAVCARADAELRNYLLKRKR